MMLERPLLARVSSQEHRRTCTTRGRDTSSTEPHISGLRARAYPSRSGVQAQQGKGDAAAASGPDSPTQDRHYAPRCSVKGKHPPPRGVRRGERGGRRAIDGRYRNTCSPAASSRGKEEPHVGDTGASPALCGLHTLSPTARREDPGPPSSVAAPRLFPPQQLIAKSAKNRMSASEPGQNSAVKSRLTQRQNSTIDFSKHTLPQEEPPWPPIPLYRTPSSPPRSHTVRPQGRGCSCPGSRPHRSQSGGGTVGAAERLRAPPGRAALRARSSPCLRLPAPLCPKAPPARAGPGIPVTSTLPLQLRGEDLTNAPHPKLCHL